MAGLRQLHKADPVGRGYTVVGFGSQCVPQMLTLALALHDAARALNTKAATATSTAPGHGLQWRVRVGLARGSVATGALGLQRQRCHFFGGAVAEAALLARECPAGETRVQRSLTKAEGANCFAFTHTQDTPGPPGPAQTATGGAGGAAAAVGRAGAGPVGLSKRRALFVGLGERQVPAAGGGW